MRRIQRLVAAGLITLSAAATAQGPRPAVLGAILPGSWQLHEIGTTAPSRTLCVRDAGLLLQLQHGAQACTRFVLAETPRSATIHYSCPGQGNGRTTLTLEDGKLLRLQTQGIVAGAPFDYDYEGRRTGACADVR